MRTGIFKTPEAQNEHLQTYEPGSAEWASLEARLAEIRGEVVESPMYIAGKSVTSDRQFTVKAPHDHSLELVKVHAADAGHVEQAIASSLSVAKEWADLPWEERIAVFLKAAMLASGPWRDTLNASTMLGQSKSVHQAEIDAACEFCDFLRFNCHFAERIYADQPISSFESWNHIDYRPLEGFVLAVSPFNFTCVGINLPAAPAMMGNVVVWKPSEKQAYSAHYTMELLKAAGLPEGVINMVHGDGKLATDVAMAHPMFAGLHFTGSTAVMRELYKKSAKNIDCYRSYPRIVGETGGKDFVFAHASSEVLPLVVALGRGAFEYQGQKCASASRAYVPKSLWPKVRDGIADMVRAIKMGDVTDPTTFMGAVIDGGAFARHREAIERAGVDGCEIVAGGGTDDTVGWFVEPTVIRTDDPRSDTMERELFGPILTVHVYDDTGSPGRSLPPTARRFARASASCATRPATSTSTTNPPARWWASSRSAACGARGPTTTPDRRSTCFAGCLRAPSRRPLRRPPSGTTPT